MNEWLTHKILHAFSSQTTNSWNTTWGLDVGAALTPGSGWCTADCSVTTGAARCRTGAVETWRKVVSQWVHSHYRCHHAESQSCEHREQIPHRWWRGRKGGRGGRRRDAQVKTERGTAESWALLKVKLDNNKEAVILNVPQQHILTNWMSSCSFTRAITRRVSVDCTPLVMCLLIYRLSTVSVVGQMNQN